jgi:hypothetical protein
LRPARTIEELTLFGYDDEYEGINMDKVMATEYVHSLELDRDIFYEYFANII